MAQPSASEMLQKFGLCLLSLDGGDARGLSTLLVLQNLMDKVNSERKASGMAPAKPYELFDLIGGSGVGG
jgi:patatin-like phospholipase/acyl hydrolase